MREYTAPTCDGLAPEKMQRAGTRRDKDSRGTHRSTRQLEQTIREYLDIKNAKPKPFVWSKTAEDILASVNRFCLRTSNSPR